jgi:uncharacterized protein (TIGR02231 family)
MRFFRRNAMRLALSAALFATTFIVPVNAADFAATSMIDAVTVYPQGADVTRIAEITVPAGEHRIILADLPATVDPRSIRVEGERTTPLEIASVDTKSHYIAQVDQDAKRMALEKEIAGLHDERGALDQAIGDANHQRNFLLGLADKQIVPQSSTESVKGIDVAQLTGLLDLVGTRLATLAKSIQESQTRQKVIDEKVAELTIRLNALSPADSYRLEAIINVAASADMKGALRISYRLNEAGWLPYYDARMVTPDQPVAARLDIVRRAEVLQSTSENWTNVALTLSTTRPTGTTAAPELGEEELMAQARYEDKLRRKQASTAAAPSPDVFADAPMQVEEQGFVGGAAKTKEDDKREDLSKVYQRQATVELTGFTANYLIPGRVSVDNSGQAKKVRISSDTHGAKLEIVTVPRVDANAYIMASFTVKGDSPMLPGLVNLYRDGTYVGQGAVPLLSPAETATLGFGVDDLVKVDRKEVKKSVAEEGILTSSNVEELAWDISVKNLHKTRMAVKVFDRMPFSASEDIEVEMLAGMSTPTEKDYKKRRGVLAWSFELEPQAETVIKTGYRMTWPENMKIGLSQ